MQTKENMNCSLVQKNLLGFIEKSLDQSFSLQVKGHIESCSRCHELYQNVFETYTSFEKLAVKEVDPFFSTRVIAEYHKRKSIETDGTHRILRILQPIAASILLLVGVGAGIYLGRDLASYKAAVSTPVINNETVETYASEYYLDDSGEQSVSNLMNNE